MTTNRSMGLLSTTVSIHCGSTTITPIKTKDRYNLRCKLSRLGKKEVLLEVLDVYKNCYWKCWMYTRIAKGLKDKNKRLLGGKCLRGGHKGGAPCIYHLKKRSRSFYIIMKLEMSSMAD
jgi:hypothetical protein